jgi:hypothetical protein
MTHHDSKLFWCEGFGNGYTHAAWQGAAVSAEDRPHRQVMLGEMAQDDSGSKPPQVQT